MGSRPRWLPGIKLHLFHVGCLQLQPSTSLLFPLIAFSLPPSSVALFIAFTCSFIASLLVSGSLSFLSRLPRTHFFFSQNIFLLPPVLHTFCLKSPNPSKPSPPPPPLHSVTSSKTQPVYSSCDKRWWWGAGVAMREPAEPSTLLDNEAERPEFWYQKLLLP